METPEAGSGPEAGAPRARPYVQYSANLARAICARVAAGETLVAICAERGMPSRASVTRWVREQPRFAGMYHRAKVLARRDGLGPTTTFCEVVAHEICARVAQGETLTAICDDPAMPAMWTVMHWQRRSAAFAEALTLAREAHAERMADEGWRMALAGTPETARLLRVQLGQLRWSAAIKSPRTHGRLRAAEPPAAPSETPVLLFKHFRLETNPETDQLRVVTYMPDPETRQPVFTSAGPWKDPIDPVAKRAGLYGRTYPAVVRPPPRPPNAPHDPEGWL